jgi:hypothetical protein
MSEYDKIVNDMGEVRKHLDAWLEVSKTVIEEGSEADLRVTLELTLEWLVTMTDLAMDTYAELIAAALERDGLEVSDSVPTEDSTDR